MRTLKVDKNNDLVIENGNLSIATDQEAVMHSCQQAIQAQYGEMIYDIQGGIPYNIIAWKNSPNLIQLEAYIRREVLAKPNVIGISAFEIEANANVITYSITINTSYGEVTLNDLRLSK